MIIKGKRFLPLQNNYSFLLKTCEFRWKLYKALRSLGKSSTETGAKPCSKNQCAVRVVNTNSFLMPLLRARASK